MPILPFSRKRPKPRLVGVGDLLQGFSIEVMPRTAAKIADFRAILPAGTAREPARFRGAGGGEATGAERGEDDNVSAE